jgi:hypothetical protein
MKVEQILAHLLAEMNAMEERTDVNLNENQPRINDSKA